MTAITPSSVADMAWIATRSKALLTTADRDRLTIMRNVYGTGRLNADPHIAAVIDALLA